MAGVNHSYDLRRLFSPKTYIPLVASEQKSERYNDVIFADIQANQILQALFNQQVITEFLLVFFDEGGPYLLG